MTASADLHRARLAEACTGLGLELGDAALGRLLDYLALLERWNAVYNLTAIRDADQMLTQHVVDCLAAIPSMGRELGRDPLRVLDVGSGGGLPGVVIAITMPGTQVVCVDAVGKKAAFVRQAAAELQLSNLHGEHQRVEDLHAGRFDLITSRAFASLAQFVALTTPHLAMPGCWMAMKGKRPDDEIAALPPSIDVFHVEQLHVPGLNAARCLVWMRPGTAAPHGASDVRHH